MEGYTRIYKLFYPMNILGQWNIPDTKNELKMTVCMVFLCQNEVSCLAIPPGPGISSLEKTTGYNFIIQFDIRVHVLEILFSLSNIIQ